MKFIVKCWCFFSFNYRSGYVYVLWWLLLLFKYLIVSYYLERCYILWIRGIMIFFIVIVRCVILG